MAIGGQRVGIVTQQHLDYLYMTPNGCKDERSVALQQQNQCGHVQLQPVLQVCFFICNDHSMSSYGMYVNVMTHAVSKEHRQERISVLDST